MEVGAMRITLSGDTVRVFRMRATAGSLYCNRGSCFGKESLHLVL